MVCTPVMLVSIEIWLASYEHDGEFFACSGMASAIGFLPRLTCRGRPGLALVYLEKDKWGSRGSNSPKANYEFAAFTRLLDPRHHQEEPTTTTAP